MWVAVVVIVLSACSAPGAPPSVASHVSGPRAQSCALSSVRRTPVAFELERWLGVVGDRSWLIVLRGDDYFLITLDDDGKLELVALPASRNGAPFTTVLDRGHLYVDVLDDREAMYDFDLETARPTGHPVSLAGKTLAGATSFGTSSTRALFHSYHERPDPSFQMLDRVRAKPLTTVPYNTLGIDPPQIRCTGDRCFAISLEYDAQGRNRLLTSFRFDPSGAMTRELLDDQAIQGYSLLDFGDQTRVAWKRSEQRGLFTRTLDGSGHALDAPSMLVSTSADSPQFVPGVPPALAYSDTAGWHLARVHGDRLDAAQLIGAPATTNFVAAPTAEGTLAIAQTTEVAIDTAAAASKILAVYAPTVGAPERPVDLLFGVRRTGWAGYPLVAPGYVAALVLVAGNQLPDGELIMLRTPCN